MVITTTTFGRVPSFFETRVLVEKGTGRFKSIQTRGTIFGSTTKTTTGQLNIEQARALQAGNPNTEEFKRRARNAEENYRHEEQINSRLFVIDAGIDLLKLRATYPDRTRYAIVHGLIRPSTMREKHETRIGGYISELGVEHINVPLNYRQIFDTAAPYEVTVAFGKRLEPWITGASKSLAAK